jgi:H+-transporting ATPase
MQNSTDASGKDGAGQDLKDLSLEDLQARLGVTTEGLSGADAAKRLQQYGYNELVEKKESALLHFLSYFWGPIPWMIEAAAVLSLFVKDWADFAIILLLLIANAAVGFWEEHQAGNAIAALKAKLALQARVKRDGAWAAIAGREVVPGDRLRLRIGAVVPADARLLDGDPLEVDQSALTGESLPVTRGPGEAVYSGAVIKRGEIDALVYATGTGTYFGKTAQLVQEAHTVSHFQQAVLKVGDYLIFLAGALVLLILSVALFRGDPFLETLQFALVLTVASVPVAMPTVLSVTMAVGARLLAAKEAVVSRLAAIEELAGMDVLCSDKTGTLTQNTLTLGEPFCLGGAAPDEVILCAALASREEDQDPIDLAILGGLKPEQKTGAYRIGHFQPFVAVHKRTEAEFEGREGRGF